MPFGLGGPEVRVVRERAAAVVGPAARLAGRLGASLLLLLYAKTIAELLPRHLRPAHSPLGGGAASDGTSAETDTVRRRRVDLTAVIVGPSKARMSSVVGRHRNLSQKFFNRQIR